LQHACFALYGARTKSAVRENCELLIVADMLFVHGFGSQIKLSCSLQVNRLTKNRRKSWETVIRTKVWSRSIGLANMIPSTKNSFLIGLWSTGPNFALCSMNLKACLYRHQDSGLLNHNLSPIRKTGAHYSRSYTTLTLP
jgi:hypothetical protein